MYKPNMEAGSCNNYFCGKSIMITHYEGVSVELVTQHAMRMRHRLNLFPKVVNTATGD
jgi:hypothetical protein